MVKKTSKNYMPKLYAKITKKNGTLFKILNSIKNDSKLPSMPKRTLYRYTEILKSRGIIRYISFGVWEIADEKKANNFIKTICHLPPSVSPKEVAKIDKRGHRIILRIVTPKLYLKKLKTHFNWKKRGYAKMIDGGRAGKYLQLYFGGALFQLYKNKIVVRLNKSFFEAHHIDTREAALLHLKPILATFESNMPVSIRIGKRLLVKDSGEFEKVNSDYAKDCYNKFGPISFNVGDFWYKQDKSLGTMNEEGNDAPIMDMLDKRISVGVMKKLVKHRKETGKDWTDDVQKTMIGLTNLIKLKIESDNTHQQYLNIPKTSEEIEKIKKQNQQLPSYFG